MRPCVGEIFSVPVPIIKKRLQALVGHRVGGQFARPYVVGLVYLINIGRIEKKVIRQPDTQSLEKFISVFHLFVFGNKFIPAFLAAEEHFLSFVSQPHPFSLGEIDLAIGIFYHYIGNLTRVSAGG